MKKIINLIIFLSLTCCTTEKVFDRRSLPPQLPHQETQIVPLEPLQVPQKSDIEILWLPPTEEAEAFIIRYGYEKDDLQEEIAIPANDVELIDDPKYGKVMHYIISDISADRELFITLSVLQDGIETLKTDTLISKP